MKIYEIQEREFWIIQAILKNKTRQCLFVYIITTIFEGKVREYPSPTPMKNEASSRLSLRYKEPQSPVVHIEQVSKNIGEHCRLQSLFETFM